MLTIIAKLLKALNSAATPAQLGMAVSLAAIMGLTPLMSPHNIFFLLLLLLFRINLTLFLVMLGFFSVLAFLIDPLFHVIGLSILKAPDLKLMWTALYNNPIWRLSQFNNTIVMGSLVCSLVAAIPLFFASQWVIIKYREQLLNLVLKTKLAGLVKSSRLYSVYQSLTN